MCEFIVQSVVTYQCVKYTYIFVLLVHVAEYVCHNIMENLLNMNTIWNNCNVAHYYKLCMLTV